MSFSAFPQKEIVRPWYYPIPTFLSHFGATKYKLLPNMNKNMTKNKYNKQA